jgi:hypothetical protein
MFLVKHATEFELGNGGPAAREIRQESLRFLMQNSHRSLDTHGRTETRLSYCKQTTGMPLTRHSYEAVTARGIHEN